MTQTITINMDKKCKECGKGGAVEENKAGLCMKCISKFLKVKLRKVDEMTQTMTLEKINYSVGDRVEWRDFGKGRSYKCYLMALCSQVPSYKQHLLPKSIKPIWEVRRTRTSHLGLISESEIVRKISSNFEGFFPKCPSNNMEAEVRRKAGMVYKLKPPKYFKKQTVEFLDHQGNFQIGRIMLVETGYDHKNKAYHTYRIRVTGWERARYVGEDSIRCLKE